MSAGSSNSNHLSWASLGLHLLVLVMWLAAFVLAALLEYAPHASLWFPPAAITFAALMVLGVRILPVLWVACMVATFLTDRIYDQSLALSEILVSGVFFACAHTAAYGLIAIPLRRMAWETSPATTLRKVTYLLVGGGIASGLAAMLGSAGLTVTGMIDADEFLPLLAPWWIGDYAGLLTLGPIVAVFLVWLAGLAGGNVPPGVQQFTKSAQTRPLTLRYTGKLLVLLGTSALVLAGAAMLPEHETIIFLMFFTVIIQLWIVHTEAELGSLMSIALVSFLVVLATWFFGLGDQALILQFVIITVAANSYFGLAVPSLYSDNRRLRHLLTHDALTGALTRSFFEDGARTGIDTARYRGEPAVLIMVDLDRLKSINDRHGHAAGDRALKILADCCREPLRAGQLLGRLSGDEFAIFLPQTDAAGAAEVTEEIRRSLAEAPAISGSERPSASFGIAEMKRQTQTYDELLARADLAMYGAKPSG